MMFLITFVNISGTFSEAVVGRCSVKKVFLKTSQNSQENACARKRPRPPTLLKKRPWHRCFPVNFVKFLRTPFYRTPLVAVSAFFQQISVNLVKVLDQGHKLNQLQIMWNNVLCSADWLFVPSKKFSSLFFLMSLR